MRPRPELGLLGGTFDPIHLGHLGAGRAAQDALHLDRVMLIPSARPPHRPDSPRASEYHRLQMVTLAAAAMPGWEVSDLELHRDGPSYTFDTLAALHRDGLHPLQLVFITGADAFAEIATWRRYPDVLDAAHFAVIARPGTSFAALREGVPDLASRMIDPAAALDAITPRIILIHAPTPDVSSTGIRQRVAHGESIEGMVPAAVAAYIDQNQLYRTV